MRFVVAIWVIGWMLASWPVLAADIPASDEVVAISQVVPFKADHRIAVGLEMGGATGILGTALEVAITPNWTIAGMVGSAFDFFAYSGQIRFALSAGNISPFFGIGYAYWHSHTAISDIRNIYPEFVADVLLSEEQKQAAATQGFALHLLYPIVGVQFLNLAPLAIGVEVIYLTTLFSFRGSPYFGISTYYYF